MLGRSNDSEQGRSGDSEQEFLGSHNSDDEGPEQLDLGTDEDDRETDNQSDSGSEPEPDPEPILKNGDPLPVLIQRVQSAIDRRLSPVLWRDATGLPKIRLPARRSQSYNLFRRRKRRPPR